MAGGAKPPRNVAATISENRAVANKFTSTFYSGTSEGMKNVELLKIGVIFMRTNHLYPQQIALHNKLLGKKERKEWCSWFSLFNIIFLLLRDLLRIC